MRMGLNRTQITQTKMMPHTACPVVATFEPYAMLFCPYGDGVAGGRGDRRDK